MTKKKNHLDRGRCACLHLRKASRAVTQIYDRYLQPAGIRSTQYAMLLSIADIENVTIGELSQCLGMDQTTTTRAIKVLYKMGFVAFATTPEDGRKKVIVLTASGVQKIKEVDPLWEEAQFKIENSFKEANLTTMLKLLNQLIEITK